MQKKEFKKLNLYYLRYILVLVLFVLAFIFEKNMNVLTPEQQLLQDQIYSQQKSASGIYTISTDQDQFNLNNLFSLKKGQCGRLFFGLRNLPISDSSDDSSAENLKIKVMLSNHFEENQELGLFEPKNYRFIQREKISFCAGADYQNLLFIKDSNSQDSSFEISSVTFYPLSVEKHDFFNLIDPIEGNTNFSKVIYQSGPEVKSANKDFKFTRGNQMIGQSFVANSDVISSVDLKMDFSGVGGAGNYILELREVENQNGKIQLSSDKIAYFYFNKDNAEKNLKVGGGIYHIPLVANLEKNKTYFVGITNQEVNFNTLNTLKVYGGSENIGGGKIFYSIGGKISEEPGSLYLSVYGADYVKVGDEKILTGAKIIDSGNGNGLYIYEQDGSFSDYLDLDQLITKKNGNIFYDNVQSGVSADDEGDNSFIYKINTLYSFTKINITAEQPGGKFSDSLVSYSFDQKNWQEIKESPLKGGKGGQKAFQQIIQSDGKTNGIFIKVTADQNDAKGRTQTGNVHLFGLKNLKVAAELKLR